MRTSPRQTADEASARVRATGQRHLAAVKKALRELKLIPGQALKYSDVRALSSKASVPLSVARDYFPVASKT